MGVVGLIRVPFIWVGALALVGVGLFAAPSQASTCPAGMSFVDGSTTICEQRFTASGTWTVPAGVTSIDVLVVGGGGGGASGDGPGSSGGGGGGGHVAGVERGVTPGDIYTITVGPGGAPGRFDARDGGNGGTSRFVGPGINRDALGGLGGRDTGAGGNSALPGGAVGDTGGGGGGGGAGVAGTGGAGSNGGAGGAGVAPSSTLFTSTTDFYGGGGGGGGRQGGVRGTGGLGGGAQGGDGIELSTAGFAATERGGGGGGGGFFSGHGVSVSGEGGRGGPGIVIIRVLALPGGDPSPSATVPTPAMLTLSLNPGEGYACDTSSVSALDGTWVDLPTAETCRSLEGLVASRLLGWATTPVFPIEIATRQISNGWGAYETFDANGRLSGVFIPAGGATLISAEGELYAIWGS